MLSFLRQGTGVFNARNRIGPCVWPHFDLLAIHRGTVAVSLLGGSEFALGPRQAILIFPETPFAGYALSTSARASAQHFALGDEELGPACHVLDQLRGRRRGHLLLRGGWNVDVERDLRRAIAIGDPGRDQHKTAQRTALLVLLLSALQVAAVPARPGPPPPPALEALVQWLRLRMDQETALSEMARQADLSTNRFIEVFRRHYATTPVRFFMGMRMHEAQRLLAETSVPIKDVARRIGFRDLPHFYRAFASFCHRTPLGYREHHGLRG